MSLDPNINTLEKAKFRESQDSKVVVAVTTTGEAGGLMSGEMFNDIQVSYPTSTTEIYEYYMDAALIGVIEVTYASSTKERITRAQRTS